MGLFSSDAVQFNPSFDQSRGDIDAVRQARDRDITGASKAGQAELGLIDIDRKKALDDLRAAQAGRLATNRNQLALSGGLGAGSSERLAQQSDKQGGLFAQQLSSDFGRQRAGALAGDIGRQQDLQNQALFSTPQLGLQLDNIQAQQNAANLQSQQAQKSSGNALFSSLAGAVGTAFGGPLGGAATSGLTSAFLT